MKAADLDQTLHDNFSEEELASHFSIRGYKLTPKGAYTGTILGNYRPSSKEESLIK